MLPFNQALCRQSCIAMLTTLTRQGKDQQLCPPPGEGHSQSPISRASTNPNLYRCVYIDVHLFSGANLTDEIDDVHFQSYEQIHQMTSWYSELQRMQDILFNCPCIDNDGEWRKTQGIKSSELLFMHGISIAGVSTCASLVYSTSVTVCKLQRHMCLNAYKNILIDVWARSDDRKMILPNMTISWEPMTTVTSTWKLKSDLQCRNGSRN